MIVYTDNDFQKNFDYVRMANPVVNSAKGTLLMLNQANIPEAKEFCHRMRFNEELVYEKNDLQIMLTKCFANMQKIRYSAINHYAKKAQISTIVDLGCGYSPRGLFFKDTENFKYIGIDLPAIIQDLRIAGNDMNYIAADMTNLPSLEKALEGIEGKILFITEGVLSYLTETELKTVIKNVASLLKKHTGLWLTPDFNDNDYVSAIMRPIFGEEKLKTIGMLLNSTKKVDVGTEFRTEEIAATKKGLSLATSEGFVITLLDFLPGGTDFISPDDFSPAIKESILENYRSFKMAVLYTNPEVLEESLQQSDQEEEIHEKGDLSFRYTETDLSYGIFLKGRLDTISSPALISFFENTSDRRKEKTIIIDCTDLEYVSSAGLRVFLMMYKSNNKQLRLVNCNSVVTSILEETGFKDIFCL